jgi:glycosyltransferase involved in cell wall biosynthesis
VRALVLSNMRPDQAHPERGSFVRDQVAALRRLDGLDVELYEFAPGPRALASASHELHQRFARCRQRAGASSAGTGAAPRGADRRFDVVHAHFGLTAWPALAVPAHARALTLHGTDLRHPRTRLLTLAALPSIDLLAVVSAALADELPARAARRAEVLPCGVELERFRSLPRAEARAELGLEAQGRYALFAADPARPEKRYDRAVELATAADAELLTLGGVEPERVPLLVNAANAVLVPSEREGFGLAVLEALACDVPVLATPVGIHEQALAGVAGTLCAPFELARWHAALDPLLGERDPRIAGRTSAERWSAASMAQRVAEAWRTARGRAG